MLTVYITPMNDRTEIAVKGEKGWLLTGVITPPADGTVEALIVGAIQTVMDEVWFSDDH